MLHGRVVTELEHQVHEALDELDRERFDDVQEHVLVQ